MSLPLWVESFHPNVDYLIDKYGLTVITKPLKKEPYLKYNHPILSFHHQSFKFYVDFSKAPYRMPSYSPKEHALLRAMSSLKNPVVIDTTAGFLKDTMLCTMVSDHVIAIETNPIIAALSENALIRLPNSAIEFIHGRSEDIILNQPCDVILIDPMFEDKKSTNASKKPLQVIQSIVNEEDYLAILEKAYMNPCKKILIKRHSRAKALSTGAKPITHSIAEPFPSRRGGFRIDAITRIKFK